jgi:hypothetical protein
MSLYCTRGDEWFGNKGGDQPFFFFFFLGVKICTIVKLLIDYSHKYNYFLKKIAKNKIKIKIKIFKESKNHQIFIHGSSR